MIETERVRLRPWREADREAFTRLVTDSEVMADQGGPMSVDARNAKFDGYVEAWSKSGCCRMALETVEGEFLGYVGVMAIGPGHPLGAHHDIGWRLHRAAWGKGYATEASKAALADAFTRLNPSEILAYTEPTNTRSIAVMERLNLRREPARDFAADYEGVGRWQGMVWSARRENALR